MCKENRFFEIGQVLLSRKVREMLSDSTIDLMINYQEQGQSFPELMGFNGYTVAPNPNAEAIVTFYRVPVGEVTVFTDRTSEKNITTLYFSDEAEDEGRGYFDHRPENVLKQPFPLGKVVQTIAVSEILSDNDIHQLIRKQASYDWGNVCQSDWLLNDLGANGQGRVVSSHTVNDETVFVITEANRSSTTIMFSYEY